MSFRTPGCANLSESSQSSQPEKGRIDRSLLSNRHGVGGSKVALLMYEYYRGADPDLSALVVELTLEQESNFCSSHRPPLLPIA